MSSRAKRAEGERSRGIPRTPNGGRRPQAPPPNSAWGIPGESRGTSSPRGPDCAPGDNPQPKLCIWRQRAAQTVHLATASGPNCASGDSERPETASGCRRMHSLSRGVSPDAQSGTPVVARCTVWADSCRRHVSLAGDDWQIRPAATAGRQTRRPATARTRFCPLPVAGASVWPTDCRRHVSLSRCVSSYAQSGFAPSSGTQPDHGPQILS